MGDSTENKFDTTNHDKFRIVDLEEDRFTKKWINPTSFETIELVNPELLKKICSENDVNLDDYITYRKERFKKLSFRLRNECGVSNINYCAKKLLENNGDYEAAKESIIYGY